MIDAVLAILSSALWFGSAFAVGWKMGEVARRLLRAKPVLPCTSCGEPTDETACTIEFHPSGWCPPPEETGKEMHKRWYAVWRFCPICALQAREGQVPAPMALAVASQKKLLLPPSEEKPTTVGYPERS